jgi:hypothetical protein
MIKVCRRSKLEPAVHERGHPNIAQGSRRTYLEKFVITVLCEVMQQKMAVDMGHIPASMQNGAAIMPCPMNMSPDQCMCTFAFTNVFRKE